MKRLILAILIMLSSCNDFLDTWEGYVIEKGKHYSKRSGMPRRLVSLQDGRHMLFKARFTTSCLYTPVDDDIHKLYGFTDCNSTVHENSVRFGWRHNGFGVIEIFAYWYNGGKLFYKYMGDTYPPHRVDEYELWTRDDEYYFRFNEVVFTTSRSKDCRHGVRTRLFPYFGGNKPAPQEMMIFIFEYS